MRYRHGVATNRGLVRVTNEDSFLVRNGLYVVCDGMGGASAGEIASQIACQSLLGVDPRTAGEEDLRKAVEEANEAIVERSFEEDNLMGMGTTLTAVMAAQRTFVLAHVGDSRAYLLRDGEFRQVTEDHSWVGELVRRGELTPAQAAVHPHRSVITRALGTESDIEPDMVRLDVEAGDRLVLCTDGLNGMVPDARTASIVAASDDPQAVADSLVQEALAEGGEDNITVVVIFAEADAEQVAAGPSESGDEDLVQVGPIERGIGRAKGREKVRATPMGRVRHRLGATQGVKGPDAGEGAPAGDAIDRPGDGAAAAAAAAVLVAAAPALAAEGATPAQAPLQDGASATVPLVPPPGVAGQGPATAVRTEAGGQAVRPPVKIYAGASAAAAVSAAQTASVASGKPVKRRRRGLLAALIVVLVIVIAVAGFGVFNYSVYYVGNNNGNVALFHGMPGKVLSIPLSRAIEVGPATYGQLDAQQRAKVDSHSLTNKEEGQKFLRSLTTLP